MMNSARQVPLKVWVWLLGIPATLAFGSPGLCSQPASQTTQCIAWYLHNTLVSMPLSLGGCSKTSDLQAPAMPADSILNRLDKQLSGEGPFHFFPTRFDQDIESLSARYGVDPLLVKSVIFVESGFNHQARSNKGAYGLMQLMPATARRFGVDRRDPRDNLQAGIRYLRQLQDRYPGKPQWVLAAYNAGESAVARYRGVPPYRETRQYIAKVMSIYQQAQQTRASERARLHQDRPAANPP